MTRKVKTIIIVLAAIALLIPAYFGALAWVRSRPANNPVAARNPLTRIGNLEGNMISRIELPNMIFEKINGIWELILLDGEVPPHWLELDRRQIENLAWSYASLIVDSILEEEPEDISAYGFDNPSLIAVIYDMTGNRVEYIRGDITPSMAAYYFMLAGDQKIYTVSRFTGESFEVDVSSLRPRLEFPFFDLMEILSFSIERPDIRIDVSPMPHVRPTYLSTTFSPYILNAPYVVPRAVDSENFNTILENVNRILFLEYVENEPQSLIPYGLHRPTRIFIQSHWDTLDILVGDSIGNNTYYAKFPDEDVVYLIGGLDGIVDINPFSLVTRLALILNIDSVDSVRITGGPELMEAEIRDLTTESFYLNGRRTEARSFRQWYINIIGLSFDTEILEPLTSYDLPDSIYIEYTLNLFPGARASISLVPYNRDFYALTQEGFADFLISRNQVNRIFDTSRVEYLD